MATSGSERSTRSRTRSRAAPSMMDRRLASSPCGKQDRLDRPAAGPEVRGDPDADGIPGAGLGHEDRAPRFESGQGLTQFGRRDTVAQHDSSDRRLGFQQGRATGPPVLVEPALDESHDVRNLGHAGHPDIGRGVEPGALRPQIPDDADRIARIRRAAGHAATDAGAGPGPRADRRARSRSGRDKAPSDCADPSPRRRRTPRCGGWPGPGRPDPGPPRPRARGDETRPRPRRRRSRGSSDLPVSRSARRDR